MRTPLIARSMTGALVLLGALAALPAAAQVQPPSTGKEAPHAAGPPKMTVADATALADRAAAQFKQPKADCEKIVQAISTAFVNGAYPELTRETEPVYVAFTVCAARTERWKTVNNVMGLLLKVDPGFAQPALLPMAKLALGEYADGLAAAVALLKTYPKDAEVALAAAAAHCRLEKWAECEKDVLAARALPPGAANPASLALRGHVLMAEALFHQGKFDASTAELTQADSTHPTVEKRLKRNEIVKRSQLAVEPEYETKIPLGIYHLYGIVKNVHPLLTLKLYNFDKTAREVRIEVEMPGVSEKLSRTKLLLTGKGEHVELTPPLKHDFNLAALRADRPAMLAIRVTTAGGGPERVLYEKSYPVTLMPRDTLPLSQRIATDSARPTPGFIAAWITPNARAIDQFLQVAKKQVESGPFSGSFTGEQHASLPQVRALWNELQSQGVSYVSDPQVLADFGAAQRTRLPAEVLQSKNAQCLEGTILFATLMEAIGLRPIIVRVPGHAFVGWHPSAEDKASPGALYFVETTAVHTAKFEAAVAYSAQVVANEAKAGHFAKGVLGPSFMLELADLRRAGFKAQPID